MAPEQVLGVRCDPRSDIYALGGILYELATGRLPFGKPHSLAELRRRLYRDPVPPRAIVPATPEWLQEIILHCLEVDARERYASAARSPSTWRIPRRSRSPSAASRHRRAGWATLLRRRVRAPTASSPRRARRRRPQVGPAPIVLVALAPRKPDEALFEALRDAARRLIAADDQCRIACVTVGAAAAALSGEGDEDTATGRHIKHLVDLRRWARPLRIARRARDLPRARVGQAGRGADRLRHDERRRPDTDRRAPQRRAPRLFRACAPRSSPRRRAASRSCVRGRQADAASRGTSDERIRKQRAALRRAVHARLLLFNYPILALFNVPGTLFGVPVLYAYIFIAWAAADRADGARGRVAATRPAGSGGAPCCRARSSSSRRSPTSGCCSRSPTTPTSAPTPGRSVIASPYIYSLSLAVYATAWTFYGSVGRAASDGVGFLPIYIGPTLMIALWWVVHAQDPAHLASRTASPRSPTSSPRATARARCSAAWSPSSR